MIHDENHPHGVAEADQFHAWLRDKLHRMRNPPWWDLITRYTNWSLRLEEAFVVEDSFARRWLRIGLPVRLLLGIAVIVLIGWHTGPADDWIGSLGHALFGGLVAVWAMGPWGRALVYRRAYLSGEHDGLVALRNTLAEDDD